MNPFVWKMFGSVARTIIAAYLADWIAPDQYDALAQAVTTLAMIGWSLVEKRQSQQKLVTALASPIRMSEEQLSAKIADGQAASVMTPAAVVPVISASR